MRSDAPYGLARGLMVFLALCTFPLACSSLSVSVDYDQETDFSVYRTYSWSDVPPGPAGHPALEDNALMEKRIRNAVDDALAARGFERLDEGGQLQVHYHAVVERKTMVLTARDYEAHGAVNLQRTEHQDVIEFTQGTLIVDIHDAAREELVWRGVAQEDADGLLTDPERAREAVRKAVNEMFAGFPPGGSRTVSAVKTRRPRAG